MIYGNQRWAGHGNRVLPLYQPEKGLRPDLVTRVREWRKNGIKPDDDLRGELQGGTWNTRVPWLWKTRLLPSQAKSKP
jgi:hypothetical protein